MAVTSASEALTYDVFLNFRGPDTRHGFTGYLRDALRKSGIITFIDDDDLKRGNEITPALKEAIEKSNVAITVFSENYASSLCCLYELAYILKCRREKGLLVLPVFYKVSPTDVRSPTGCYGKALDKLDKKFQRNIDGWKKDLAEAAGLAGLEFKDGTGYEYEFVGKIVEQVFSEINHDARIYVADCQVQLGSQVSKIRELLDVERDAAAHIIGIHGMGGVGKSTLARQVYNLITGNFEVSCFFKT